MSKPDPNHYLEYVVKNFENLRTHEISGVNP